MIIKLIPFAELSPLLRVLALVFVACASTLFFTAMAIILVMYIALMLVYDLVNTFFVLPSQHLKAAFQRRKLRRK